MKKNDLLHISFILILTALAYWIFFQTQPTMDYAANPIFDGNQYLNIYYNFTGELAKFKVSFPFHSRILVPFLASILPVNDPIESFHLINVVFGFFSVITIFILWKNLEIKIFPIYIGIIFLIFHWPGLIRYNILDPVTVDLPLYFFQVLFLIIILKKKWKWLIILSPIATLQKESFIPLLIILFLFSTIQYLLTKKKDYPLIIIGLSLAFSILAKMIANHFFPPLEEARSSAITLLFHLREMVEDPFRIVKWAGAFSVAYAAFAIALFYWAYIKIDFHKIKNLKNKINQNGFELLLILFSITYLAFGILAGGDMTRILFLGFPFLMTSFFLLTRSLRNRFYLTLFILSLPVMRVHKIIPTPENWEKFAEWFPEFSTKTGHIFYIIYGLVILVFLYLIQKLKPKFLN
jgi:hypothetical protein